LEIPSEFPGTRFKKIVDRVFKDLEGFWRDFAAISTVKRERVSKEERERARKREKEEDVRGFW